MKFQTWDFPTHIKQMVKKGEDCLLEGGGTRAMLRIGSPTLANLENDHEFISKESYLHWYDTFWGSPKQSHKS